MLQTTTVHECDHCGHMETVNAEDSVTTQQGGGHGTDRQFWRVQLVMDFGSRSQYGAHVGASAYWCRKCCEKFGLSGSNRKDPEQPAPPTFDEILREMIREEVESASAG